MPSSSRISRIRNAQRRQRRLRIINQITRIIPKPTIPLDKALLIQPRQHSLHPRNLRRIITAGIRIRNRAFKLINHNRQVIRIIRHSDVLEEIVQAVRIAAVLVVVNAHEIEVAAGAVPDEIVEPSGRVVVPA